MTYLAGPVNPLDGTPLKPGQVLVTGPDFTGPRVSVVWEDDPTTWPRWITPNPYTFQPEDNGDVPGGTYTPQQLPELTVTASSGWSTLLVAVIVLWLLSPRRRR